MNPKIMDSPTSTNKLSKPTLNRMKIPKVDVDSLLGKVRGIEDSVANLIQRFESSALERNAMIYALREVRLQLKRLTDVDEGSV